MINVSFSEQELTAVLQLMDIAVKANGLQVAPAAVAIQQKLVIAFQEASNPQPDETTN